MKRFYILSIMVIFILLFSAGCMKEISSQNQKPLEEDKLVVYTSIYPLYNFAQNIGKDKIQLELIVPPGAEPHDWEPTAKLMAEMERADVFIYNGVGLEMWAKKVIGSLDNSHLIVVEASRGIPLLKFKKEEEHTNHKEEQHAQDHSHGLYDPHVWLDPVRAIQQAENIKNAFIEADQDNKDFYETNYRELVRRLKALDEKFKEELRNRKRSQIVVAHAAFGYLADRYGLEQISLAGISPQEEPSAAKMAELTKQLKDHDIKYVFFETLTNPRLSQVLAAETGAKTEVLNPIGGVTQKEIQAGKSYISIMEENLRILKKALGE